MPVTHAAWAKAGVDVCGVIAEGGKANPSCYDTSFCQSSNKEQLINPRTMSARSFKISLSQCSFSAVDICPRNNAVCSGDGVQCEQCLASDDSMYARVGVHLCTRVFVHECLLAERCYYVVMLVDML